MQIEDRLFDEFINKYSPYKYHKTYLKNLLTGSKANSLCRFEGYNTTEHLAAAMMDSVSASVRGKDTVIGVYKDLVAFLSEKGIDIEIEFPPVSVDSSLDRLLFIARHFQKEDATIEELPNILWVSERTIESDIARLKGEAEDILAVCGRKFYIPETKREDGRLNFASTLHPLFLTENLTQVIIMLEGLKHMAENPDYKRYAETTAANIWEQLSDYAKDRIHKVIGPILPGDVSWYDSLERELDSTFYTENNCSVPGNVFMESIKSDGTKPCYIEYEKDGETVIYENCVFVPGSRGMTEAGAETMDVDCSVGRVTLENSCIRRTSFKIEELL